jgi:hypothetical protein
MIAEKVAKFLCIMDRHGSSCSWNLTERIPSPSRSQLLYPKITQSFLSILGDREMSKKLFLNFYRIVKEPIVCK